MNWKNHQVVMINILFLLFVLTFPRQFPQSQSQSQLQTQTQSQYNGNGVMAASYVCTHELKASLQTFFITEVCFCCCVLNDWQTKPKAQHTHHHITSHHQYNTQDKYQITEDNEEICSICKRVTRLGVLFKINPQTSLNWKGAVQDHACATETKFVDLVSLVDASFVRSFTHSLSFQMIRPRSDDCSLVMNAILTNQADAFTGLSAQISV